MKPLALILLLSVMVGCSHSGVDNQPIAANSSASPAKVATDRDPELAIAEFDDAIHHEGVLVFRSWSGNFIGADSDTDLRFLPNLHVEMVEYGLAVATYKGTYQIDAAGQITATFIGFDHQWPAMSLRRDLGVLELRPAAGAGEFVMGNRGGATLPTNAGRYWPFRRIAGNGKLKPRD